MEYPMEYMKYIEALNLAGTDCLIAENEVAMLRMLGGLGRRMDAATQANEMALREMFTALRESGLTIAQLEALRDDTGASPLAYGVLEILKREYGKY